MDTTKTYPEKESRAGTSVTSLPPMRKDPIREEAKERYRDPANIAAKWIDQYGNISKDNDYQRNRACVTEVFNMLDVVMDICIDDFRSGHYINGIDIGRDKRPIYSYTADNGDTVTFSIPTTFARRVRVLRQLGYDLSDELSDETRLLRNETTHGNQTIMLQHLKLGYEETMHAMLSMADALITLGRLDESLRVPSFDMLRVREGDTLLGGAYTIEKQIGEGGMSRVYKAVQRRGRRQFAIKELKPGSYSDEMIRREYRMQSVLHHSGIPQLYDVFSENGTYYKVMTLIDGVTLEQYRNGKLQKGESAFADDRERSRIIRQLCGVLRYLHSGKISLVFADLSPDNIMISKEGNISLIDFGSMCRIGECQPVPAVTIGYSAPEVFAGRQLDQRADIYSFGYMLWFLYTGLTPEEFPGDAGEGDGEGSRTAKDYFSEENKYVAEVICRCTARNPEERFSGIQEAEKALFPSQQASGTSGTDSDLPEENESEEPYKGRNILHKKRGIRAALAAMLIAGAAVFVINVWGRSGSNSSAAVDGPGLTEAGAAVPFEEAGLEDHVMQWGDDGLESEMRRITGIEEGDILLSDVWDRTELSVDNCGIRDISSLGELKNLSYLSLMSNQITDVTALSGLTGLKYLNLEGNRIESIDSLSSLKNLQELDIGGNRISDISVIAGFEGLTELAVNDNEVDEAGVRTVLESMREKGRTGKLNSLNVGGLGISDCSWITEVTEPEVLESLYLSDNDLTDITPLGSMKGLRALYLSRNSLTDISAMASMPHLSEVDIQYNPVSDIWALGQASELTWLDAEGCELTDLSPIRECMLITSIDCSGNRIGDLSPLEELVRLSYLDAGNNRLSGSLDCLKGLTALTYLDLKDNEITDISALEGLTSIRHLYLDGNPIEDYSPISDLQLAEN